MLGSIQNGSDAMKLPPLFMPVWLALCAAPAIAAADAPPPDAVRLRELVHVVRQDCGSCHGLTLAGGLGPALTDAALADKPADSLVATVLGGRPGTPMPPFAGIVTAAEAQWIVEQLQLGFPADGGAPAPRSHD